MQSGFFTPECAVQKSIALPDMHSGYGFAIGNVAAFDMGDPEAVVSPGGVGFDINCGVRLIRTNLVRPLCSVAEERGLCARACCWEAYALQSQYHHGPRSQVWPQQ